MLSQDLRYGQDQIGCRDALTQSTAQPEAYDLGDQHRHRLPKHRGLGLDTAYAPSQHGEAIDHRRMAIGSYHGVGIGPFGPRFLSFADHTV